MADILLFHHAHGLTTGVLDFAETLRGGGHTVRTPDMYEGRVFGTLAEGLAYAENVGFGTIAERGRRAAESLPGELVYAGFSLGVVPAQMLAQTRSGAKGALFCYSCLSTSEFGGEWPAGVPVQVHGMAEDDFFAGEGDVDAARALVAAVPDAELFLYPGKAHIFADSSLPSYDGQAASLLTERVLRFLDGIR
jgi:dienelactone hydrolase